jgi:hypothetical protein
MNTEESPTWVKGIAVGFLCVTFAMGLALAAGDAAPRPRPHAQVESSSGYVPPGMKEANADTDVGPGSDEAQAVTSPWADFAE